MGFRLLGVDVEIQFGFWFTALMLSMPLFQIGAVPNALVMMGVILVSVLVHEYGHALAIMRHRIEPEIALHWMGGTTTWRAVLPLRRRDHVVISLAGPFAGFGLAALAYGFRQLAPGLYATMPPLGAFALERFELVNVYWGIINLLPVLPFDGGHVLEHALGPKRARITAAISCVVGAMVAVYFLTSGAILAAFLFGMGAFQSFQRFRVEPSIRTQAPVKPVVRSPQEVGAGELPPDLAALLRDAKQALDDEDLHRAVTLSEKLLWAAEQASSPVKEKASAAALHVLAWARYLGGRVDEAEAALGNAGKFGPVDAALAGTLLMARQRYADARRVLESARAAGDDRKEVVGPLIQVLLAQGEVARAAAVALDVVESLSEEDVRRMAELAFSGGAFDWSARLYEVVFRRERRAEDAYAAARGYAKLGDSAQALSLLRAAVEAGFSDGARAWSDAALSSLREEGGGLSAVIPRP